MDELPNVSVGTNLRGEVSPGGLGVNISPPYRKQDRTGARNKIAALTGQSVIPGPKSNRYSCAPPRRQSAGSCDDWRRGGCSGNRRVAGHLSAGMPRYKGGTDERAALPVRPDFGTRKIAVNFTAGSLRAGKSSSRDRTAKAAAALPGEGAPAPPACRPRSRTGRA